MKVFIWEEVDQATDSFHPEGGVVVFAETLEKAIELANKENGCNIASNCEPDEIREVIGGEEKVYIMPNAGCC